MSVLLRSALTAGTIATAMLLTVTAAACGGDAAGFEWPDEPSPRTHPPADPSPSFAPDEAEAVEEILAVVDGFRKSELEEFMDPRAPQLARPAFAEYLADPFLSQTLSKLNGMYQNGVVYEGRFYWEPQVMDIRLKESPPTATVRDCVDVSRWRSVFADSGNPVSEEDQADEQVTWFKAMLYPEGWLLYEGGVGRGEQC